MKTRSILSIAILLFSVVLFSCRQEPKQKKDAFSSKPTLFAEYISAYTSGYIPKNSEITVKLTRPVGAAKPGKEIETGVFSFKPSLKGKAVWSDEKTIIFKPAKPLESGERYKAIFHLARLVEVPEDQKEFKFTFECIPQDFVVEVEGLVVKGPGDKLKTSLTGTIRTTDESSEEDIEKVISASQNGTGLPVRFEHGIGTNLHRFIIEDIRRSRKKSEITIAWDGDPIGVDKEGKEKYTIPPVDEFQVLSVNIIRAGDQYISVRFSDPVMKKQNMRGLIYLSGSTAPRIVANDNELKVYVQDRLMGKVKLTVDKSIKNINGKTLSGNYQATISFASVKPDVRITASDGVIMPGNSEGLIIPFEAVALSAVDLTIVRIFENNVLQYLQVNNPGGNYQLRRVGRPVVRKTIPLTGFGFDKSALNKWNRYTIDISDYINVEPGAFYQVRIGFKKSYSLYFCPGKENSMSNMETEDIWEGEDDTDWDDYGGYYYYDWRERDNPCHDAYFYAHRGAEKIVFASNIGLMAKKADEGDLYVFSTDLLNAGPLRDVALSVYDYQQQLIAKGVTDSDGKAVISLSRKPFVIVAKKGGQTGYLKVDGNSALSLSNFNVSGSEVQKGLKGFIYGERGVWRPGDTLHLSFMLEDIQKRLPEDHPVVLELFNPMGQLFTRKVQSRSVEGLYAFHPVTSRDAPTGNWQAKVKVGGVSFQRRIKIETVKPNRLKIDLTFDGEKLYASKGIQYANLKVRWLHGAIARNLKVSYEAMLVPVKTIFKKYEGYVFDDPSKEFITESDVVFEGRLNERGEARMPFKFETGDDAPGMLKAVFKGKVFEESGDFSIDNTSVVYVPYTSFAGLKVPVGENRGMLETDKDYSVPIATVDARGRPVSRKVEVSVYKLQWRWWWDNSWESKSNYTNKYYSKLIKKRNINTVNGKGIYQFKVNYPGWGRYFIKVKDLSSGHTAGSVAYVDWPSWRARGKRDGSGGATMLNFTVEKDKVEVGEKIRLNIPSSEGGKALVSLETGSEVLKTFWVDTEKQNTLVEFEATSNMAPNIFAYVTLFQPHAQTINDLPLRMYGIASIEVADADTKLHPLISMPDKLQSEEVFTVSIEEKDKKAMAYTIAIVEEGLLDLTKFKTPEPWKTFYAKEALGIRTWDLYDYVMGAYGGALESAMAVGGDEEIKAPEATEANRFKPVVLFKGPFFMKKGQKIQHKFRMPPYIGSVRVMVVAGYEGAYGHAEKTVPVKQPLMVLATLPRVARPGEEIVMPVNVFATEQGINNVEVSVEAEGKMAVAGNASKSIAFTEKGDKMLYFNLKAAQSLGKSTVRVKARSGSYRASYDVELQVKAANPEMVQAEETLLEGGKTLSWKYEPLGLPTTNDGVLELSSLPPINLEQRTQYLIRYPHGCIEQITSSAFAQLYLGDLTELGDAKEEAVQQNINAAIAKLKSFQLAEGGFTYWPGRSQPALWSTNYACHFLIVAKNKGYHVPGDMLSSLLAYQKKQANNWTADLYKDYMIQAYRLYSLALAGKPAIGAMNRLKGRDFSDKTARWLLASAYTFRGHDKAANEIIDGLTTDVTEYTRPGPTYGSALRDKAIILETLVRLGKKNDAFEVIRQIAEKMGNKNYWMSTQTTAYCLVAIAEFARSFPVGEGVKASVNVSGSSFRVDGGKYVNQVTLIDPDKASDIEVKNNGNNPVFVRLIRSGVPMEGEETAKENNIKLMVQYRDMKGNVIDVSELGQGTGFVAEVTVTNPGFRGRYEELAISQIFPSGWEILNNRLDDTESLYKGAKPEYQDIRDDRVLTYFNLEANKRVTFKVYLNASYQGAYYLPAVSVSAMYDNSIAANTEGQWVKVVKQQ